VKSRRGWRNFYCILGGGGGEKISREWTGRDAGWAACRVCMDGLDAKEHKVYKTFFKGATLNE